MQVYTENFFDNLKEGSKQSAKEVVPLVLELIQPQSVVDVGCGSGEWLSVFKQHGINDILGIDGDYVDRKLIAIPPNNFLSFDLTKPLALDKKFDLVVSLETAEHLPSKSAEIFVDSLTQLGSVILFSAAIPFQGGTEHINERWPEYWNYLFQRKDYEVIDCIRPQLWRNQNVEYWYIQNTFMFVQKDYLEQHEVLKKLREKNDTKKFSLVHPQMYLEQRRSTIKEYESAIEKYIEKYETSIKEYESAIEKYEEALEWTSSLAKQHEEAAKPQNMSLKKLLFALPIALQNSLNKKTH